MEVSTAVRAVRAVRVEFPEIQMQCTNLGIAAAVPQYCHMGMSTVGMPVPLAQHGQVMRAIPLPLQVPFLMPRPVDQTSHPSPSPSPCGRAARAAAVPVTRSLAGSIFAEVFA